MTDSLSYSLSSLMAEEFATRATAWACLRLTMAD
jgi:hypothetical protein